MYKSSKQEEQTRRRTKKTTWTGVGMLVKLVKAVGASNKWINTAEKGQYFMFCSGVRFSSPANSIVST